MSEEPIIPENRPTAFRSRPGVPSSKRVYPIAVHNQVEFNPAAQNQTEPMKDDRVRPCFRCGVPMRNQDMYGTFDGNPVCKVCFLDLERKEADGELDEDYVNTPSLEEEQAAQKAQAAKEAKANPPDKKEDDSGSLGGLLGF